jgi:hemoglobin
VDEQPTTLYELVGGTAWFVRLVDRFYEGVAADPRLRPLYPDDLSDSKAHLVGFLVQYWGGPTDYSDARGHPRLRMRHVHFAIGAVERDAWYEHMAAAVEQGAAEAGLDDGVTDQVLAYFSNAAAHLVNTP